MASEAPQQSFVRANGLRLACLDYGNAGAPPAVLVHATGFHKELWGLVARALAPSHHVLAFDQRGHGDSDKPAADYHWQRFADDLAGFLDALRLRGVLAIGHSSGGTAIVLTAAQRPELIGRAVLVEPVIFPRSAIASGDRAGDRGMGERTRQRRESFESPEAFFQSFRDRPPFKDWTDEALWTYARAGTAPGPDGRVHLKCPPSIEAQVYENNRSVNPWPALEALRCPTLFIQGGSRGILAPDLAEQMRTAVPHLRHVQVAAASHFVPMEQPEAVSGAIQDFLQAS
ncbi:MAG: alpha/beta hydrolase [Chloroflexi bacterium]|nr:alpha/beta hydrolase [Chloroflexota bacterium]